MGYRYKWKPSKIQKEEYKKKCIEKESLLIIHTSYAIRSGCYVEFYSMNKGEIIKGYVLRHSYGSEKGQHTFSIMTTSNTLLLVKGRNLYPNLLKHIPGMESKLN